MRTVFADTYYYLALLNPRDRDHAPVLAYTASLQDRTLTTAWVITEVGDALSSPAGRPKFLSLLQTLRTSPLVQILPPDPVLFEDGVRLYSARPDKEWSLTDCISFVAMQQAKLTHALTGDHHFVQAGFTIEFPGSPQG